MCVQREKLFQCIRLAISQSSFFVYALLFGFFTLLLCLLCSVSSFCCCRCSSFLTPDSHRITSVSSHTPLSNCTRFLINGHLTELLFFLLVTRIVSLNNSSSSDLFFFLFLTHNHHFIFPFYFIFFFPFPFNHIFQKLIWRNSSWAKHIRKSTAYWLPSQTCLSNQTLPTMVDCSSYHRWPNKGRRSGVFPHLYRFIGRLTSCFSTENHVAPCLLITCLRYNYQNHPGSFTSSTLLVIFS